MGTGTPKLTRRQQEVLAYIRRSTGERGLPPTRADIVAAFGFRSPNSAEAHLRALARKGAIELVPGASRGIRVLQDEPANDATLPLVGRVAAGEPILAEEYIEDHIPVDPAAFYPRADFLLRVTGDSMVEAGIHDGDFLAVQQRHEAYNNEIVVARMGDEITVKRFRREGNIVRLMPENRDYAPIRIDLSRQDLWIEGRAVGLVRRFGTARL